MPTEIETDYLVVGAGASGLAFTDALVAGSDARVVLVDRHHQPGGHWLDAYSFVRLHQPSAVYGVASRRLGQDRIDESGPNAGFYERATAAEICEYFRRVLEEQLLSSGRVRFLGLHEYRGADSDGHHVVSLLTGAATTVRARKLVDATYIHSDIPSHHQVAFSVDADARLATPNQLVDVAEPPGGFTVIGAGKTAMDAINWLLDMSVDPDHIQWVRPRDGWLIDRKYFQPLKLVGSYMDLQARWVEAAAEAVSGEDFAHRLEAAGILLRLDENIEPDAYRGPIVSRGELDSLRTVERVVRKGKVRAIGSHGMELDDGHEPAAPGTLYVDCTAAGVRPTALQPIFAGDRITIQHVTVTGATLSAATIGAVETARDSDMEKNRLCPPTTFGGKASELLEFVYPGMSGLAARSAEPDLMAWAEACRLNPAGGAMQRLDDPQIGAAMASLMTNFAPAMKNLARRAASAAAPA